MLNSWRNTFNSKEFSLGVDEPKIFLICQWQKKTEPSIWYFIYRWLISIYLLTTWLISVILVKDTDPPGYQIKYFIYLTNWGYTFCTLQAFLAALMLSASIMSYRAKNYLFYENRVYKVYWVINLIATPVALVITVIYWTCIYDGKPSDQDVMNVLVHGMNSVVMFLDFWMVSHPVRIPHFIYAIIFSICYATFSAIYYLAGGTSREGFTYIYPILDWSKPLKSVLVVLAVVSFVVILHVVFYVLYLTRRKIHRKYCRSNFDLTISMSDTNQRGYNNEAAITSDNV